MHSTSRYNVALDNGSGMILVNLLTDAILEVDSEHIAEVQAILETPNEHTEAESFETLADLGFVVRSDFDELAFLKLRHTLARAGSEMLGLSILPTLRCNLRCVYCYEEHRNLDMDEEIQSRLLAFAQQRLQVKRGVRVSWFGGEPLLRRDIVRDVSKKLLQLCETSSSTYEAQITSNGYLLDRPAAEELASLGVSSVQVTLDGPASTHDARRILPSGEGTYERVLGNVLAIADLMDVRIRVNLDQETARYALELLDDLDPVSNSVAVAFRAVVPTEQSAADNLTCFSNREFSPIERSLVREASRRGFRTLDGYAHPGSAYCGAYQFDTHIVDPRGDVFACVQDVGRHADRTGTLAEDGKLVHNYPVLLPWASWSPFEDEACLECNILPICMGGCLKERDDCVETRCKFKYDLEERIRQSIKVASLTVGEGVEA